MANLVFFDISRSLLPKTRSNAAYGDESERSASGFAQRLIHLKAGASSALANLQITLNIPFLNVQASEAFFGRVGSFKDSYALTLVSFFSKAYASIPSLSIGERDGDDAPLPLGDPPGEDPPPSDPPFPGFLSFELFPDELLDDEDEGRGEDGGFPELRGLSVLPDEACFTMPCTAFANTFN